MKFLLLFLLLCFTFTLHAIGVESDNKGQATNIIFSASLYDKNTKNIIESDTNGIALLVQGTTYIFEINAVPKEDISEIFMETNLNNLFLENYNIQSIKYRQRPKDESLQWHYTTVNVEDILINKELKRLPFLKLKQDMKYSYIIEFIRK
jgi:hypothetical protein